MPNPFKIGDEIILHNNKRGVVSSINGVWVRVDGNVHEAHYNSCKLYIPDPTEQAVRLLTEAGYTVVPPPPKRSGKIYLHLRGGIIFPYTEPLNSHGETFPPPIAIVDWTEGDGL
jgi:hypothetical protein